MVPVNLFLYGFATAGKVRVTSHCDFCLGSEHTAAECSILEYPNPDAGMQLQNLETAVLALVAQCNFLLTPVQVKWNEQCLK